MQLGVLPQTVYATYAGLINQDGLNRIFHNIAAGTQRGATDLHLLFQSTGGLVGDGIALYNYFKAAPIILHLYNTGSVASIAMLAFLGARHRYVSQHATFMIHKTVFPTQTPTDAVGHRALATSLDIEDRRTQAIVRDNTTIPDRLWRRAARQDVVFQAQEAVHFGIAQAIREFQVPSGDQVFNF